MHSKNNVIKETILRNQINVVNDNKNGKDLSKEAV